MALRKAGPAFWDRLAREIEGDAASDPFARGRYATDASMYQCFPAGAARPKSANDVAVIIEMAREEGLPVVARGGGTSTAGQALGEGVIVDFTKHLTRIVSIDAESRRCVVEPGCSPAALNAALEAHGLVFPVEIGSAAQATIGGMLGNNSSGLRAMRHGSMRDAVASVDAFLADGQRVSFRPVSEADQRPFPGRDRLLELLHFGELHEKAIATLWPLRALGTPEPEGYDLRTLLASAEDQNMARLLAGAEGTLAIATSIELKLAKKAANRALGVCRLEDLAQALRLAPKIAALLNPSAIELLDKTMLEFLAQRAGSDAQAARLLRGEPGALLIVEFDEDNPVDNSRLLKALAEHAAEANKGKFPVIEILGENAQSSLWRLRREALNRAWTLKSAAQPVAFLEDGAVPLSRLAAYGEELQALFGRHGVRAAIYGQAGRGCLHVRPVLNLRHARDRKLMRELAQAMSELLRAHGGALTAGSGLGVARSEALERSLGPDAMALFRDLKTELDPGFLFNPGKILRAPRFDDEAFLRAPRESEPEDAALALSWGSGSSRARALSHIRRCSGLGHCRSAGHTFACPSLAATRDERDSPRGRANTMRLALSGQLGEKALGSDAMLEGLRLCVSCKFCGAACPHGVDIPKLKVEALAAARSEGRFTRAQELFARLPDYTDWARRRRLLVALRDLLPGLPRLTERWTGITADRPWPKWSGRRFKAPAAAAPGPLGTVALFADTFNRSFEPENLRAASSVLTAAGYAVVAFADGEGAPLCCGRTYYDAGYVEEARQKAGRIMKAAAEFAEKGIPVVGLEPACVLMMRDEYASLGLAAPKTPPVLLFEEFIAAKLAAGHFTAPLRPIEADVVLHPHCHERTLGLEGAAEAALKLIPKLAVNPAPPTCCGLNGLTGLTQDTLEASLAMAETALFPAIRKAGPDALVAATAYSCRKQINDGMGRAARHPAALLELALKGDKEIVG
jgi:FAD/FMN-containing dehydrogenase/Fe-S oxidoreductase